MNIEYIEINGFLIDQFNQHGLEEGKTQGFALCALLIDNLKTRKQNVLPTIGNVVSVPVTTVTQLFSFIHINVKELVKKFISGPRQIINQLKLKLKNGLTKEEYLISP